MRLKDKVCIITGTSGGIGKGIAQVFAEEGAKVICASREEETGQKVARDICQKGGQAIFFQCDISDPQQVKALIAQTLQTHGRIDVLVNNAGVNFVKAFDQLTVDDWDHVMNVDLRGTFLCTRACIDSFLKQGSGNVVNIATVHTQACMAGAAPYDAAKWGMVGLTKSLAVEYASRGIRFNCLSPGLIDTQIWQDIQDAAEDLDACMAHWDSNIPAGRVGRVREIAMAAVFLASDDASYITGANLLADGGMTSQLISQEAYKSRTLDGK